MTKARNNHYVPQWYQEGFFEPGQNTYSYLDLNPRQRTVSDGRVVSDRSKFISPASRAFCQRDLYSTFFGTTVNDEIERRLFGDIDTRGADAVRAFSAGDASEQHRHFTTFFEYLDIQKIRTPKGLDWLRAQYPRLSQNDLMFEMQGIRMMHCTIWTEGVREIVSAQDAAIKFIVSDHPIKVYNYALPKGATGNVYPNDPGTALKSSQTIFPLNRDFCLILTNLEYAQDHSTDPLEKRTFAGNYRRSMVRTDAFIRARRLTSEEVTRVNRVLKAGAKRYIAGGKEEWLYPETSSGESWADLRGTFLPPKNDLWRFGGEMYAQFESGEVHYQDAFGRTEKAREFLKKEITPKAPPARDLCGCGSGRRFGECCERKRVALRPTWAERSIRERNLLLFNGISKILEISEDRDWTAVRRDITDDKIRDCRDRSGAGRCSDAGRYRRGGSSSSHSGGALGMIPSDTRVFLAAQPVDFRKGPDGLLSLVRDAGSDPFNRSLYVFRAKRADRIKIVWFDGSGVCLFAKRLEKSSFCWPKIGAARIRLNSVQLAALVDGLDWKRVRPSEVRRPTSAG